jgi:hypothetical protein
MNELIWYSFPGGLVTLTIGLLYPDAVSDDEGLSEAKVAVLIGLTPLVGFLFHQLFRLGFELSDGFARKSRTVLDPLQVGYSTSGIANRHLAFLLWETVFYGKDTPESFRNHVRRSWHYILSFWGMTLAGLFGVLIAALRLASAEALATRVGIADLVVSAIFWWKARTTYVALRTQEVAFVDTNPKPFADTAPKIGT